MDATDQIKMSSGVFHINTENRAMKISKVNPRMFNRFRSAYFRFIFLFLILLTAVGFVSGQTEIPAAPAAGQKQFKSFIHSEMIYPESAWAKTIEETIELKFRVEVDGTLSQMQVKSGSDPDLINEAKRLIKMVVWSPAQTRGMNVPSFTEAEVDFNLKKYGRIVKRRGYDVPTYEYPVDTSSYIRSVREIDKAAIPDFGGSRNLAMYLDKNLVYPDYAKKQGISGIVKIKFVIETNGHTSNYVVLQNVQMGCTEEAMRVLESIHWKPAFFGGKAVRSWNSASIRFGELSNDFKFQPANQFNSAF
jgi:hypothetical protein